MREVTRMSRKRYTVTNLKPKGKPAACWGDDSVRGDRNDRYGRRAGYDSLEALIAGDRRGPGTIRGRIVA